LVISLTKDDRLKARQLCGSNTRISVRGLSSGWGVGEHRRFLFTKTIRQPFVVELF
jgi:hypothetical protein